VELPEEKEHTIWWEGFDWAWLGVLRFSPTVDFNPAIRIFDRFVLSVEDFEKRPLSWILGYDVKSSGLLIRVLIAGIKETSATFPNAWWNQKRVKAEFFEFDVMSPKVRRALKAIETSPPKRVKFILRSEHRSNLQVATPRSSLGFFAYRERLSPQPKS
jgi:hypothetical protein